MLKSTTTIKRYAGLDVWGIAYQEQNRLSYMFYNAKLIDGNDLSGVYRRFGR